MNAVDQKPFASSWRLGTLLALVGATIAIVMALPPIPQDPAYHAFADQRALLGVPHALDVLSNLPFLAVGVAGVVFVVAHRHEGVKYAWAAFFIGVGIVAFGSSWYHLDPRDETLVWDRLPMTIAFLGLFAAILAEHVHTRLEHWLLWPGLVIGFASVAWWVMSGDLRAYAWVQFAPLLVLLTVLWIWPAPHSERHWLALALGAYVLAKILEALDRQFFDLFGGVVSGHSLKHLAAAAGGWCVLEMLRRRRFAR